MELVASPTCWKIESNFALYLSHIKKDIMQPLIGSLLVGNSHSVGICLVVGGCLSTGDIIPQNNK